MLAYASPSNRIAIVITGLVTQSIAQGQFHNSYHHFSTLAIFTLLFIYLNSPQFLFMCSLLFCKPILSHLQSTSTFILVLGKANVKRVQSRISGRQDLREYLFYLQLLVGFDTLTYRKRLQLSRILAGYQASCGPGGDGDGPRGTAWTPRASRGSGLQWLVRVGLFTAHLQLLQHPLYNGTR